MTVTYLLPDEEYERLASVQKEWARRIADRIEAGDVADLDAAELGFVAAVVRKWAEQLPLKPARKRGAAPKFDSGEAAARFAKLTEIDGMSASAAYAKLAEDVDVSVEAMKKAIAKQGDDFIRLFRSCRKASEPNPKI